jgi:hypothetical protein
VTVNHSVLLNILNAKDEQEFRAHRQMSEGLLLVLGNENL